VIEPGQPLPDVGVWVAPSTNPVQLRNLLADGPILLFFYLYDWSTT
jgi:hypothetical protein